MVGALLRYQPFKTIYLSLEILGAIFIRLPWWIVISLPRSLRPRPSWSLKQCLTVRFIRFISGVGRRAGPLSKNPNHKAIEPCKEGCGIWVEPVPQLLSGDIKLFASVARVEAVPLPGYWLFKNGDVDLDTPPIPGEKIIYCLHGGGYNQLSAHPSSLTSAIPKFYLKHIENVKRCFSIEYRLCTLPPLEPSNHFPAALIDALAGYDYLVNTRGFSPKDIIFEGDSAGGNLALALTRYLIENRGTDSLDLPLPPSSIILISPWVDLSGSDSSRGGSAYRKTDYLNPPGPNADAVVQAFVGPHGRGIAQTNRYISPASVNAQMRVDFHGFPRTFIVGGGCEALIDSIRVLRDRMVRDLGEGEGVLPEEGKVHYHEAEDGIHDYLLFDGWNRERMETLDAISKWVAAG